MNTGGNSFCPGLMTLVSALFFAALASAFPAADANVAFSDDFESPSAQSPPVVGKNAIRGLSALR